MAVAANTGGCTRYLVPTERALSYIYSWNTCNVFSPLSKAPAVSFQLCQDTCAGAISDRPDEHQSVVVIVVTTGLHDSLICRYSPATLTRSSIINSSSIRKSQMNGPRRYELINDYTNRYTHDRQQYHVYCLVGTRMSGFVVNFSRQNNVLLPIIKEALLKDKASVPPTHAAFGYVDDCG